MLPLPIAKKYRSVWNQHLTKNLKFTQEKSAGAELTRNHPAIAAHTSTKTDYCQSQDNSRRKKL